MPHFTHIDDDNQPAMVDVSEKEKSRREATAESIIFVGPAVMSLLKDGDIQSKKGPVFHTAIIAGTMAAKRTSEWIPFCHPLPLEKCKITIQAIDPSRIHITCTCLTTARTGVEMEALTGASAAALTIYDMCKAVDKSMVIESTRLLSKSGGKSDYQAPQPEA